MAIGRPSRPGGAYLGARRAAVGTVRSAQRAAVGSTRAAAGAAGMRTYPKKKKTQ